MGFVKWLELQVHSTFMQDQDCCCTFILCCYKIGTVATGSCYIAAGSFLVAAGSFHGDYRIIVLSLQEGPPAPATIGFVSVSLFSALHL